MNEKYYEMDYDSLKKHICGSNSIELLKDIHIKRKLIDSPKKYDFIWFVQDASLEILVALLDEEGIFLLSNTSDVEDKMNAILTSSKVKDYLFHYNSFCNLVIEHINYLENYLYAVEGEGAIAFCLYLMEHYPNDVEKIFLCFRESAQEEVLKEISLPFEMVRKLVVKGTKKASEYLLTNDLRFTTLTDFSFNELFALASKSVKIPSYFLQKNSFIDKVSTIGNIKNYRFLIDRLSKENDVSMIESARKKYYESEISSFIEQENMLERHFNWYQDICKCMENNGDIIAILDSTILPYYSNSSEEYDIRRRILDYYRNLDKIGLKRFLEQESHLQLTNMIVDYHFEQVPYNFFIDLKQLIHFQEGQGRTLSEEEIEIYSKLLLLDDLPYKEVKRVHTTLSNFSMIEKFYDQFRSAKDKEASLVQQAMLTETSIQKYRDENMSRIADVDIYVLDGDEFYAFVKSTRILKDTVLVKDSIFYGTDGGSYSLDGSSKLQTFKDPRIIYNLIYSSFPESQVVHMFPVDSFSNYTRDGNFKATTRIYELHTPEELVTKSNFYDEILLSLPNMHRNDELNASLKKPKIMGIYCYDTITDNDVISARNLGVGIVLVKTKNYQRKPASGRLDMFDTMSLGSGEQNSYDYLSEITINDMETRRK